MTKFLLNFKSAYGQLVALVFLPILILAGVGGVLVFSEVRHAILSERNAIARAYLVHYETLVRPLLTDMSAGQTDVKELQLPKLPYTSLEKASIFGVFGYFESDEGWIRRVVVIDDGDKVLIDTALHKEEKPHPRGVDLWQQETKFGMAYGIPMMVEGRSFWLIVEMDNRPLTANYYRVLLALGTTGLTTLLLLLLILSAYSKRWITPLYEMRIYLQNLDVANLSLPIKATTNGEFTLLYRDLVQATRRLQGSFDEIRTHAEETERDLQHSLDEMEERNAIMEQAHKSAMGVSRAKSDFLANISHELRTPLNSIDGFINLLSRQEGLSSQQTLYIQTIKKSSAHLLALVNDVLDFSKIDAGKLILENHEFDLHSSIYDVVDMLSPSALEKQLRLCVLIYNDVPTRMMGDSLRVKQILTNLVGNAIKFTDSGGVIVKVGLADTDGFVHISIEDSGKGISDIDARQLFESFSQGDLSVTRRYGGTGLGLVISRELVKKMGGNIGCWDNATHNKAKSGATFWFEIPTGTTDEMAEPELPICLDTSLNILVWINHAPVRKMLKSALAGTQVGLYFSIGFADLLEQLDKENHGFDWVIVDYFGQDASLDDVGAVLRQIRLRYQGHLATYGYQVGMDNVLLSECQAQALYEPMDKRQLFAMLCHEYDQGTTNEKGRFEGKRVLVVDDYPSNLLVLDALLSELGVDVVQSSSGFDAIEVMTKATVGEILPIDLVFMDIQMPHMSGLDATLQIRKIQENHQMPPVPIIALTAHGLADEKERLVSLGMNDYVSKPISQTQLLQILQTWLSGSPQNILPVKPHDDKQGHELSTVQDIDWKDAQQRAGGKAELAKTLLSMVIETAGAEKHALERAWADRDRRQLADIAHRLVGASRYTGVPRLRQASESFEVVCRDGVDDVSDGQFISIRPSYRDLIDALDNLEAVSLDEWITPTK